MIFADGCVGGLGNGFVGSVQALALTLDRELRAIDRRHPLLVARHVFGEAARPEPEGAELLEGSGIVLTAADYGCAWQGGHDDHPLARADIRNALEFGVNVAVYGRQRQRPLEALELEV